MLTLTQILVVMALAFTLVAATGRLPLWPAVLLIAIVQMLTVWPR
jgi:hypothetical protein